MATITEDFEDTTYNIDILPESDWSRSQVSVRSGGGLWSFQSSSFGHNSQSNAYISVPSGATTLQFWYLVSSESGFDFLGVFGYNGTEYIEMLSVSGDGVWTQSSVFNVASYEAILFEYSKDGSESVNLDAAFIDDVTFTTPVTAGIPSFTSRPNRVWRLH